MLLSLTIYCILRHKLMTYVIHTTCAQPNCLIKIGCNRHTRSLTYGKEEPKVSYRDDIKRPRSRPPGVYVSTSKTTDTHGKCVFCCRPTVSNSVEQYNSSLGPREAGRRDNFLSTCRLFLTTSQAYYF